MRAIVNNQYCTLPDHSPQPGRVLVQTSLSARRSTAAPPMRLATSTLALMRERSRRVPGILMHDGFRFLLGKTSHLIRREMHGLNAQASSFVGRIVDDSSPVPRMHGGQRVAGTSITHPPDTELVLARPDYVFPIDERCSDTLASLALYGGLAVYASSEAMGATDAAVGVAGSGVLAHLVASVLAAEGRQIARLSEKGPLDLGTTTEGPFVRQEAASVWIETEAATTPRGAEARQVIGLAVPLRTVRHIWPTAESSVAADVGDVIRGGEHIVDLFYDDGEPEWPACLEAEPIERYLDLATAGKIFTGPMPKPVEIPSGSWEQPDLAGEFGRFRSSGCGIILTRFEDLSGSRGTRLLKLQAKRSSRPVKSVSVVGAGEWPLGMILRQILRDKRIALRGACDRRPEILHLASQALPFEFLTTCYDDLLSDNETDLIVVAPFHGAHAPHAAAALRAGKHCFVEKPPAVDQDQLGSLIDAATASDGFLYVGYNRRFAPATKILLEHLGQEEGPLTINIVVHGIALPRNHWYFWPSNGNRIISNTCHFIDYALTLAAPAKPIRVTATPSSTGRPDENVIVAVAFDDGSIASITYTNRGSDRRPIYYQAYHAMKGDVTGLIEDFARLTVHRKGKEVATWAGAIDLGHRRQMRLVADALVDDAEPPVPLAAAMASASTVLAAAESARIGEAIHLEIAKLADNRRRDANLRV